MTTKDKIIYESLLLFSRDGFEAVSTRTIARAIDCSDAVIYKHFKSKKEILDCIIEICTKRLLEKRDTISLEKICWKDVEDICLNMFKYQTSDEWIVPFRRLLVIEQFKNPELGKLYREVFIDGPVSSLSKMFKVLIDLGYMKAGNPEVYALDLYSPFFMFHTIGVEDAELIKVLKEHVTRFRINSVTDAVYLNSEEVGIQI